MRRGWMGVMGLVALLLAGCVTPGKRGGDVTQAVYDLESSGRKPTMVRTQPLALEVRAPAWFDGLGIDYRLAYADSARLREYALARWAGPPAQMIQWRLMRDLGASAHGQVRAACLMRLELEEFSQVFDSATQSRGVLRARVQWLDRQRNVLDEWGLDVSVPAPTPDVAGGVFALRAAVDRLAEQISQREQASLAARRLSACQG